MQRSRFQDYATTTAVALVILSPTVSTTAGADTQAATVEVRPVRRAWPIAREPAGAWGVVGETVIRNHSTESVRVAAVTVALLDARKRVLQELVYDTPDALTTILGVYSGVGSGLPVRQPRGTAILGPGDVAMLFTATLTEAPASWAAIAVRFSPQTVRRVVIPLEPFQPEHAFVWPLPLNGLPWVAGNTVGTPFHWWNGAIVTADRVFISQRFAIDTVRVDSAGRTRPEGSARKEDFYAWGADVTSMGRGQVVAVADVERDLEPGDSPSPMAHPAGNFVVVRYGPALCAVYAHLQQGSVRVSVGDVVERGQVLGRVGSSGNTTEPHLHVHFADRWSASGDSVRDMYLSQGLPALFWHAAVWRSGAILPMRAATPLEGDLVMAR